MDFRPRRSNVSDSVDQVSGFIEQVIRPCISASMSTLGHFGMLSIKSSLLLMLHIAAAQIASIVEAAAQALTHQIIQQVRTRNPRIVTLHSHEVIARFTACLRDAAAVESLQMEANRVLRGLRGVHLVFSAESRGEASRTAGEYGVGRDVLAVRLSPGFWWRSMFR